MPADIENVMALGALRGIAGFPLEHPFDVLKLRAHSSPLISTYSVAKNLFQEHNIKGLYLGGYTHFAKLVVKESFRWPVVALSMKFWKRLLPEYENNHIIPKLASSVTIALFKSSVLLPVERLMVARVNEEGYRAFFKNRFSKEGISSLYKGWSIYFARYLVVWSSFLSINHIVKKKAEKIDPQNKYPVSKFLSANFIVAAGLVATSNYLDFLKTQVQMDQSLQKLSTIDAIRLLWNKYGMHGVKAGFSFSFCSRFIHAIMAGALMDKITES